MTYSTRVVLTLICLIVHGAVIARAQSVFTPGKETRVADPSGEAGHYLVYVPSDYKSDRLWPVIYFIMAVVASR